jgi:NitT/TauT family transport system permease protein
VTTLTSGAPAPAHDEPAPPTAAAAVAARPARRRHLDWVRVVAPAAFFAAFVAAWEGVVAVQDIDVLLLPAPHEIVRQFLEDRSLLFTLARNTFSDAARGVLIGSVVAVAIAAVVYRVRWLAQAVQAYASTLKALPVVALFPIVTVFFGITSTAVVAIVAIGTSPVVFAYAVRGFLGTSEHDELMRSISAGPLVRFRVLVLPRSLPYLMAGLRTAVPTSIIIAVIAQYFGGSVTTLGSYIRRESTNLHTLEMWAAILMSCVLGLACFGGVALADRLVQRGRDPRR